MASAAVPAQPREPEAPEERGAAAAGDTERTEVSSGAGAAAAVLGETGLAVSCCIAAALSWERPLRSLGGFVCANLLFWEQVHKKSGGSMARTTDPNWPEEYSIAQFTQHTNWRGVGLELPITGQVGLGIGQQVVSCIDLLESISSDFPRNTWSANSSDHEGFGVLENKGAILRVNKAIFWFIDLKA
ncbi:hypothetical protein BTVI_152955 [Pitangus sulphuratus]|nr:hypothetical protein BTVI_152955 [Pitangus sulphuratus]